MIDASAADPDESRHQGRRGDPAVRGNLHQHQPPQITDADVSATQEFARTAAGILLFLEVADTCPALPKLKGAIYWLRGRWKPGFREATEP
jgi:hypothetical protein